MSAFRTGKAQDKLSPITRSLLASIGLMVVSSTLLPVKTYADDLFDARWYGLSEPCDGRCSAMIFGGKLVETSMAKIFLKGNVSPFGWSYGDSSLLGFSTSRTIASLWNERVLIEPEFGFARRFGSMSEYEIWSAVFFRYTDFPWNDVIYTTVAASTGLNYASGISPFEKKRSGNGRGDRLLHYLAPEITFALPEEKEKELVMRFHHRSGAYGLISDTGGGAQYLTVGLRFRF